MIKIQIDRLWYRNDGYTWDDFEKFVCREGKLFTWWVSEYEDSVFVTDEDFDYCYDRIKQWYKDHDWTGKIEIIKGIETITELIEND